MSNRSDTRGAASPLAGLIIITALALVTVLLGTGKLLLNKGSTAAAASGCTSLPKQPRPLSTNQIAARGSSEVVGFGRIASTPERVKLAEAEWARLKVRFDSFVNGFNQFKCADVVEVYARLSADGVLPSDFNKPETQRLMIFLTAALDNATSLPVFAVPPISVSDQARAAVLIAEGDAGQLPANTDQPTYRVELGVNRFLTSIPSPDAAIAAHLVNTTSKTLGQDELGKLGASKWSVSLTTSGGSWTATKDIPAGAISTLAPGAEYSTTDLVVLRGPTDRRLDSGPAVLTGQLTTKGKPIEAAARSVRIEAI